MHVILYVYIELKSGLEFLVNSCLKHNSAITTVLLVTVDNTCMCIDTRELPTLQLITLTQHSWEIVLIHGSTSLGECDIALSLYHKYFAITSGVYNRTYA